MAKGWWVDVDSCRQIRLDIVPRHAFDRGLAYYITGILINTDSIRPFTRPWKLAEVRFKSQV